MGKFIVSICIGIFFFIGCAQKENVVIYNAQNQVIDTMSKKQISENQEDIILESSQIDSIKDFSKNQRIALIYATNSIGKYSIEAINTLTTYLSMEKEKYQFEAIDIEDETKEKLKFIVDELIEKGIKKVIFLITDTHIEELLEYESIDNLDIYFPIINKETILKQENIKNNIIFGGINYTKQFETILNNMDENITIYEFYDEKELSLSLHHKLETFHKPIRSIPIYGKTPDYEKIFEHIKDLNNSYVILNTSIIKSSIILSQLRGDEIVPLKVFSTQLNYTPLIFVLTQATDRNNFITINAIGDLSKNISHQFILSENDVRYNWVNYTTLIGLEYLMSNKNIIFGNNIVANQVIYTNKMIHIHNNQFLNMNSIE